MINLAKEFSNHINESKIHMSYDLFSTDEMHIRKGIFGLNAEKS